MSYTRMTIEKRIQVQAFRQAGFGIRQTAREPGVSSATVSRETLYRHPAPPVAVRRSRLKAELAGAYRLEFRL